MAPTRDSEWAPQLEQFDGVIANLPTLSDVELEEAIAGLRALEREGALECPADRACPSRRYATLAHSTGGGPTALA